MRKGYPRLDITTLSKAPKTGGCCAKNDGFCFTLGWQNGREIRSLPLPSERGLHLGPELQRERKERVQRKGAKERCKRMQFIAPPTEKMFHEKGKNVSRSVAMFHGKARNVLDFLSRKRRNWGEIRSLTLPF